MRHDRNHDTVKRKICSGGICLLSIHLIGCEGAVRKPLRLPIAMASHGALSRSTESLAIREQVCVIRRLSDHFQTVLIGDRPRYF
jgi:hypothetical protein